MKRVERLKRSKEKSGTSSGFLCPTCAFGSFLANKKITVGSAILVPAFLGSAILRFPIWCSICPIGIFTQGMFHLKAWTHVSRTYMPVMVEFWLIPVFAVLLSLREKRYYCRKICPVGALIKLVSKFNPFLKPVKNPDKCVCPTGYEACQKACPQGLGPQEKASSECTKCMECYVQCKNKNVRIKWFETPEAIRSLKNRLKKAKDQESLRVC